MYRAKSTGNPDRIHLMECVGARNLTIDGRGATISPTLNLRVLNFTDCEDVAARGLNVDYDPLPFVQGDVVAVTLRSRFFDIRLQDGFAMPAAESIEKRNRAGWPFGCSWNAEPSHFGIERVDILDGRTMRVYWPSKAEHRGRLESLIAGKSGFDLPHPDGGNTGGFAIRIERSAHVTLSDVNVWSVPQFTAFVDKNKGPISFRNVRIEPKPGSERTMCGWRDGFFCKDNRGPLQGEDCAVSGLFDDTFSVSSMLLPVAKALSATEVEIVWLGAAKSEHPDVRAGDLLVAVDTEAGREAGRTTVKAAAPSEDKFDGRPVTHRIAQALGIALGELV